MKGRERRLNQEEAPCEWMTAPQWHRSWHSQAGQLPQWAETNQGDHQMAWNDSEYLTRLHCKRCRRSWTTSSGETSLHATLFWGCSNKTQKSQRGGLGLLPIASQLVVSGRRAGHGPRSWACWWPHLRRTQARSTQLGCSPVPALQEVVEELKLQVNIDSDQGCTREWKRMKAYKT